MVNSENKSAFGKREIITLVCLIGFFGFLATVAIPNFIGSGRNGPGWNANACINNLRQIDGAKQQWALENGKTNGGIIVTENDIRPYLRPDPKRNLYRCPSGGKYTVGKLKELPTCSLGTNVNPPHVLP